MADVRRFLEFAGYYRRFVKDYAKIAKPLNDIFCGEGERPRNIIRIKSIDWFWSLQQDKAFQLLIQKPANFPILAYADFTKSFELHTDASCKGLGEILFQHQNGVRAIAYTSRGLSSAEVNYPAHKLEFLVLNWSVTQQFHDYLYGNKFIVRTDNNY